MKAKLALVSFLAVSLLVVPPIVRIRTGDCWLYPPSMSVINDVRAMSVNVLTEAGQGSGVLFHRFGHNYVLTAAHVTYGLPFHGEVTVTQGDRKWKAVVINSDEVRDLAVLRLISVRKYVGEPVELLSAGTSLPVGTRLLHVGNILGFNGSYIEGVLSAVGRHEGEFDQTSLLADHGSSGGGVFTADGRLAGILTRGVRPGLCFFVPARLIHAYAEANDLQWLLK